MARFQVKTLNNAREWDANRKYKVNETVTYNGGVYQNVNGKQSVPTDSNNWVYIKAGDISNLEQVTSEGNYTSNNIQIDAGNGSSLQFVDGQDNVLHQVQGNGNLITFADFINSNVLGILFNNNASLTAPLTDGTLALESQNFVFVDNINKLPADVSGIITLLDNYTYYFTKSVDLQGKRLVCGVNTVILGASSENVVLSSTGLIGTALITSNYSLPIRNITITADVALNLDGDGTTTALDWFGVNFTNCNTVGTIQDYTNHVWTDCAFLESGNLTYNGVIGSIAINSSLFNTASGQTAFILPNTLTISRRFRVIYSAFICLSGESAINLSSSTTIPDENYILDNINFSGGGTYLLGVTNTSNKALFRNCVGINNTFESFMSYAENQSTATTIATVGTYVKANVNTTSGLLSRFTHSANRATYTGAKSRTFEVSILATITSASDGDNIAFKLYKNGSEIVGTRTVATTRTVLGVNKADNIKVQTIVTLAPNDYIELWVTNLTDTSSVTVTDYNAIIR